jgi:fucose 4-O-acetylase-like acetyltransferase
MNNPVLQPKTPLQKERIVWIDQLKGIAFFFVILGHLDINSTLLSWICSFHMPLFFFVTGFNLKTDKLAQTKPLDYLKRLTLRLLVPYVWMQLLCMVLRFVQKTVLGHTEVPAALYMRGIVRGHSRLAEAPSNPLYFVLLLFLAELLLFFLIKLTKGRRLPLFALTFALLPLSLFTEHLRLPWHLNVTPAVAFLILCGNALGQLYRKNEAKIRALSLPKTLGIFLCLALFGAAVWYFNGRTSIHGNHFGKDFSMALLTALATTAALALLTMKLPKLAWLTLAGQNTLLFMGLHKPMLLCMEALFPAQKKTALFIVCAAAACYALLLPVTLWFRRFAPFVIGVPSDFADTKIKIGQAVCVVGATCVPYLYAVNHLKGGLLVSTPLYCALSAAAYLLICTALWFALRRFVRFPFLPQKEPTV